MADGTSFCLQSLPETPFLFSIDFDALTIDKEERSPPSLYPSTDRPFLSLPSYWLLYKLFLHGAVYWLILIKNV